MERAVGLTTGSTALAAESCVRRGSWAVRGGQSERHGGVVVGSLLVSGNGWAVQLVPVRTIA